MQNCLRRLRKRRGVTLADLSKTTGLSIATIGNFETGARGIGAESLDKVAQALGVSVAEILHEHARLDAVKEECGLYMADTVQELKSRIATLERELDQAREVIHNQSVALAQGRAIAAPAAGVRSGVTASKQAERRGA